MINRVDGNNYYDYTKSDYAKSIKTDITDTGEKFSLGDQRAERQTELKAGKTGEESVQGKGQAAERGGVRIELSGQGMDRQKRRQAAGHTNAPGRKALAEKVRAFFTAAVAVIGEIFGKLWNASKAEDALQDSAADGDSAEVEAAIAEASEETVAGILAEASEETAAGARAEASEESVADVLAGEAGRDHEIRKHLQNGEIDQVIRLLTDDGRRTAARNSTLLTCYDKSGRVVRLDASIRQRALYGDRNSRKL